MQTFLTLNHEGKTEGDGWEAREKLFVVIFYCFQRWAIS